MSLIYPPFAALLAHAGARPLAGTRTYDEQTTDFLAGRSPFRAGTSPQNFGVGAVCEAPVEWPGLCSDGTLVSLDTTAAGLTLPMLRTIFEPRGRHDLRLGLAEVFAHLDRFAPYGGRR